MAVTTSGRGRVCYWHQLKARDTTTHPTGHRTSLNTKNYLTQDVISVKLQKTCYKVILSNKYGNFWCDKKIHYEVLYIYTILLYSLLYSLAIGAICPTVVKYKLNSSRDIKPIISEKNSEDWCCKHWTTMSTMVYIICNLKLYN